MREPSDKTDPIPEKNPAAAELGRRGGMKGGATRAARMSQEERTASARQAAATRWARIAAQQGKPDTIEETIPPPPGRAAKPFVFRLTPGEALEITEAAGTGGQQTLHRRMVDELARGNLTIVLTDTQLGELIRYMTRYGQGGFQNRLRMAFGRSLKELLNLD
jgi:hypothetical protein